MVTLSGERDMHPHGTPTLVVRTRRKIQRSAAMPSTINQSTWREGDAKGSAESALQTDVSLVVQEEAACVMRWSVGIAKL